MGEMADFVNDPYDIEVGFKYKYSGHSEIPQKTCRACGTNNLHWEQVRKITGYTHE